MEEEDPLAVLRVHVKALQGALEASSNSYASLQQRAVKAEATLVAYQQQAQQRHRDAAAVQDKLQHCNMQCEQLQQQVLDLHQAIEAQQQAREGTQQDAALLTHQLQVAARTHRIMQLQQQQQQHAPVQRTVPEPQLEAALCSSLQQQVHAMQEQLAAAHSSRAQLLRTWNDQQQQLQQLGSVLQQALSQQQQPPLPQAQQATHQQPQQPQQENHKLASVVNLVAQLNEQTQQQAAVVSAKQQQLAVLQARSAALQQQADQEESERSEAKVGLALLLAQKQRSKAALRQLRAEVEALRQQQAAPARCAAAVPCEAREVDMEVTAAATTQDAATAVIRLAAATGQQAGAAADADAAQQQQRSLRAASPAERLQPQQQPARQLPRKRSSQDNIQQPVPPAAKRHALRPGAPAVPAGGNVSAVADGLAEPELRPASKLQQETQQQAAVPDAQPQHKCMYDRSAPTAACDVIDLSQDDDDDDNDAIRAGAAAAAPTAAAADADICAATAKHNRRPAEEQQQATAPPAKGSSRQASPTPVQPAAAAAGSRLPSTPGIHEVTKPRELQQLRALLAASPAWGFSVAFDSDTCALPRPTGRAGAAAAAAAAAAADDDDWLADGLPLQQQQQRQRRSKQWSWSVLGVAFSVAGGCAYYVPLTRTIPGVVEAAGDPLRVGSSERMKQLWQGLADIFCSSKGGSSGPAGSSIAVVAAAAAACTAAVDALVDPVLTAAVTTGQVNAVDLSDVCPPAAAADAWGFGSTSLTTSSSSSSSQVSLGATYALKSQLAALASPPAASGFCGFVLDAPVVDVRVAAWLLQPDDKSTEEDTKGACGRRPDVSGLQALLARHAGPAAVAAALGPEHSPLAGGAPGLRHLAACRRACLALKLHEALAPQLQAACAIPALMGLEMPLVRVLAAMEAAGMPADPAALHSTAPAMEARLAQLEAAAAAYNAGGAAFSLTSAKKVRQLLFDKLKLVSPARNSHTRGGERSTSSEVLQALATQHPLPGLILQHRKLHKLKTGFMNSLGAKLAQLQQQQQRAAAASGAGCLTAADGTPAGPCALLDGECTIEPHNDSSSSGLVRIRGSFLQTNTATGRLSMDDPALQTMPRPLDFTLEGAPPTAAAAANRSSSSFSDDELPAGAAASGVVPQQVQVNVRAAFVAPPGWVLLSADYSQIELRLMAHLSRDPQLLAALAPDQADPFVALAAQWLRLSQQQVTPVQRNQAKRLAYGLLYGMGAQALAAELCVSVAEALRLAADFRRSHAVLDAWMAGVVRRCTATGWVATLAGRRRHLTEIRTAGDGWGNEQQAQAMRRAVNTTCQGSAADVVKGAMVALSGQLQATGLGRHCRMLLQVHDELLFEVAQPQLQQVAALVRAEMEGGQQAWGLAVALPVKLAVGRSWGELQDYVPGSDAGSSGDGSIAGTASFAAAAPSGRGADGVDAMA